ncbi:hypothetical protein RHMOL_Rhmol10G0258800 [Rhododendron molle]|uniref:Uncharacterized protein n=1 Tax=Rhododendron molle TaxID=49168 RepID=A0ACC0M7C8_RHOML|nr:hypothetical protein RHMOL_Rhmol10G0258800 [Rhododendron molle]
MENPSPATAVTTDYQASGDKGANHRHRFDCHNPTTSKSTTKNQNPHCRFSVAVRSNFLTLALFISLPLCVFQRLLCVCSNDCCVCVPTIGIWGRQLCLSPPGIPGCAKSALYKEIVNAPGGLGDDRLVNSLMGDLIKGKYWDKVNEQCRRKHYSVILADKIAPNEEVWSRV